jgi:hypothetical protein
MNEKGLPDKAYDNAEFLISPEARTIRILSEYLEPETRLDRLKVNNTVEGRLGRSEISAS